MATPTTPHAADAAAFESRTMRKVGLRLIPFLVLCYFIAYVDRVNVGFAALTMNHDLGLSAAAFGLGGGLFFVAYVLFEVPSNLAMERVGARIWIARIMITWGLVGIGSAFVTGPVSFATARFLLGAAEAGFFPGVILYLTYWFPKAYRARIVAMFMVAIPLSSFFGSPLSAALLTLDGAASLRGWQWLLIMEAVPAVLLGVAALALLPSRPAEATFLTPAERGWLTDRLEAERRAAEAGAGHHAHGLAAVWAVLASRQVWLLAVIYAGSSATSNTLSLWMPQILKGFGLSNLQTGLLNMIPFGIASVFMIVWGLRADRSGERIWSTALPLALTSVSFALTLLTGSLWMTLVLLSLVLLGNYAIKGPFFALATETLPPAQTAAGIAAINTLAHLGTGAITSLIGVLREQTGSFPVALLPLCALTGAGCALVFWIGRHRPRAAAVGAAPSAARG
ncbi:MFS transporter [Methylobacterium radiotolerans]|uniref:MFS transporter n=1 Tax=Methylobacterium radiotolerans TaxID=31998 RepID=UPI0006AE1A66|nr:MFS transporter [Methylobacterium radiotolerans]ONF50782.1 MFS transporter permease [Methylobacterium radiotolerans]